jgi:hypothetical protein
VKKSIVRLGRPRVNLEQKILADMSEHDRRIEAILRQKVNLNRPFIWAFEAACLLLALERGTRLEKIRLEAEIPKFNNWAKLHGPRDNGPRDKCPDAREFLKSFIEAHAPGWDWRKDAAIGEVEDWNYERENKRIAKERAEDARWRMACTSKFYTPDVPDAGLLLGLAWKWRHKKSWPTLRELKLAVAIPERLIRKIIKRLRPKKGEIIKGSLRHKFSRRGAVPLHYGPRLVIGVLHEFLGRLSEFPIDDEERKRLRKSALTVKRSLASKLSSSH